MPSRTPPLARGSSSTRAPRAEPHAARALRVPASCRRPRVARRRAEAFDWHSSPVATVRELRVVTRASVCTFFEVRCKRVDKGWGRAHFLRFVAAIDASAAHGGRPSRRARCKSAGQINYESTDHNLMRAGMARGGRKRGAHVQRTSKNVHETRCRRRALARRSPSCWCAGVAHRVPSRTPPPAGARRSRARPTRGQPHETCTNRRRSAAGATCAVAAGAASPRSEHRGDLWRFRKANVQMGES